MEEAAERVVIASDDGSIGIKGTVLDAMEAEGVTGDCIFFLWTNADASRCETMGF
ncbi:MAG: hypothetical protein ACLTDT_09160 [Clostridium sp.]